MEYSICPFDANNDVHTLMSQLADSFPESLLFSPAFCCTAYLTIASGNVMFFYTASIHFFMELLAT